MIHARRFFSVLVAFLLVVQVTASYGADPQSNASPTSSLSGRVIAKGDSGIDGVKITCTAPQNAVCRPSVVSTDKDGKFSFPDVTPSTKYRLTFEHARYLHIVATGESGEPMTVQMEPYLLKGRIFEDGSVTRVPDASVTCVKKEGPPQTECSAATDNDGRFSIQPLQDILDPSTTYDLIITHGRFPSLRIPDVRVSDPPKDIEVHLQIPVTGKRYPVETKSGFLMEVSVIRADPKGLLVRDEDSPIRAFPGGSQGRSLQYSQIQTIGPETHYHTARNRYVLLAIIGVTVAIGIVLGRASKGTQSPGL
jgi:carboxypeptidase family protein